MRVTWVHPSWRDLVIDYLGGSAQRRRAFLDACGPAGLELALSTAGGPTGTRRLPLVTGDDDWDALGDAIHRLSRLIAQDELARMLTTLETAIVDAGTRERAELEAITELVLNTVRRRLDREGAVIDANLLERWHALANQLTDPAQPPSLGRTLAALDPAGAHPSDAASVQRLEDYLAIIEATGQPLPDGIAEDLGEFVRAAERGGECPAATRAVLRRIARVHAELAPRVLALLDEDAALRARTATAEPIPPAPPDHDGQRIRRILADL